MLTHTAHWKCERGGTAAPDTTSLKNPLKTVEVVKFEKKMNVMITVYHKKNLKLKIWGRQVVMMVVAVTAAKMSPGKNLVKLNIQQPFCFQVARDWKLDKNS